MKSADKRCQELESKFWKRASLSRAAQYEDTDNHKRHRNRSKSSEPGSNTNYQDEPSEKRLRRHKDFVAADQDTIEIDDDDDHDDDDEQNASQPRGCVLEDPKLQDDDRDPEQIHADKFASHLPPPYRIGGALVISDPRLSKQESSGANTENEDTQYDGLSGSMRTQHQVDNSPVDLTSDDN